jgi:hypothetical protein
VCGVTKRKNEAIQHRNIFGNSTVLDYSQFHVPVSVYRHWSELELRLYLFLMETMSKADSRSVVLSASDIFKATGIHDSQLGKVRDALRIYGVIDFRAAKGFRGGWSYEAMNPVTGERIKSIDYMNRDGLTRAQIERYADTRLRRSNLSMAGTSSIMATCPLCGDDGTFVLHLPDPGKLGKGDWECVGACRSQAAGENGAGFRGTNGGELLHLELAIMRRKRKGSGKPPDWRSAQYSIERIIQNTFIDFDPDDGYLPRTMADETIESKLNAMRDEVLSEAVPTP